MPECMADYCDQPAVAAVYIHGTIIIRPDHLTVHPRDGEIGPRWDAIMDWRCIDCLHGDIDVALGFPDPSQPTPTEAER
jgi:hypothetical protein